MLRNREEDYTYPPFSLRAEHGGTMNLHRKWLLNVFSPKLLQLNYSLSGLYFIIIFCTRIETLFVVVKYVPTTRTDCTPDSL